MTSSSAADRSSVVVAAGARRTDQYVEAIMMSRSVDPRPYLQPGYLLTYEGDLLRVWMPLAEWDYDTDGEPENVREFALGPSSLLVETPRRVHLCGSCYQVWHIAHSCGNPPDRLAMALAVDAGFEWLAPTTEDHS